MEKTNIQKLVEEFESEGVVSAHVSWAQKHTN